METGKIRLKAMCLLVHDNRVLVGDANTFKGTTGGRKIVPGNFYRVLGGSVDFDETAENGVRREIREELKSEIENLEQVDVVESLFTYAGEKCHEIVFLFKGQLAKKELCEQESIHIDEDEYEFDARWIPIDELLNGDTPLYPALDYKSLLEKI
jgi:ADP-ribose pyrophosphatase YjhB (NUDIX family)